MSNNETLLKIVIFLVLINIVSSAPPPDANDLYGRFSNRLEEVARFAENEFRRSTSSTLKKIYAMNAKILEEQISERKNAAEILKFKKNDHQKEEPTNSSEKNDHQKEKPTNSSEEDLKQSIRPTATKTVNITLKFLPASENAEEIQWPNSKTHEIKADELEFEFPTGDSDLQLAMELRGEPSDSSTQGCARKREMFQSKALDEFIDVMSAPAQRSVKGNCHCGCENCRSLTRMSSSSCNCNCERCNKCKRNEMFNYSRQFHKRFQGKFRRDTPPFSYPSEDIYTKILSTPYNPVMPPDTTLEKLLRLNVEMPGGNDVFNLEEFI